MSIVKLESNTTHIVVVVNRHRELISGIHFQGIFSSATCWIRRQKGIYVLLSNDHGKACIIDHHRGVVGDPMHHSLAISYTKGCAFTRTREIIEWEIYKIVELGEAIRLWPNLFSLTWDPAPQQLELTFEE